MDDPYTAMERFIWKLSSNVIGQRQMKFITLDEEIFLNLRMAANDMKLEAERWQIHR